MKNKECLSYNSKKLGDACLAGWLLQVCSSTNCNKSLYVVHISSMLDWSPVARIWRKNAYGALGCYTWYKKFKWYKMYDKKSNCVNHRWQFCLNMDAIGYACKSAGRTSWATLQYQIIWTFVLWLSNLMCLWTIRVIFMGAVYEM